VLCDFPLGREASTHPQKGGAPRDLGLPVGVAAEIIKEGALQHVVGRLADLSPHTHSAPRPPTNSVKFRVVWYANTRQLEWIRQWQIVHSAHA